MCASIINTLQVVAADTGSLGQVYNGGENWERPVNSKDSGKSRTISKLVASWHFGKCGHGIRGLVVLIW